MAIQKEQEGRTNLFAILKPHLLGLLVGNILNICLAYFNIKLDRWPFGNIGLDSVIQWVYIG